MTIPDGVSGVRWDDGWTECREHLGDDGWDALMAAAEVGTSRGVMLIGPVVCDPCRAWGLDGALPPTPGGRLFQHG